MDEVDTWTVTVTIGEHDGHTRAVAHLQTRDTGRSGAQRLTGVGFARLAPTDLDVPEVGAEIAVARALAELSRSLLHVATEDVEQLTGHSAQLVL